jgi:hypothetical protein
VCQLPAPQWVAGDTVRAALSPLYTAGGVMLQKVLALTKIAAHTWHNLINRTHLEGLKGQSIRRYELEEEPCIRET